MNTWAERVRTRMKELDLTQEDLANKLGVTRGAVTHYLAGRRVPPLRQFQKLAAILKVDPAWLQFGTTNVPNPLAKKAPRISNNEESIRHAIPILSWEQIAELTDVTKIKGEEIKKSVPHFYSDNSRWYALQIKGDSMAAPLGHKSFHEGDIIIVDPDQTVKHGGFVIALLPRAKEVTFKQYVVDGGVRYLKPLNPQYPLIQINESTHMCGVIVACFSQLDF